MCHHHAATESSVEILMPAFASTNKRFSALRRGTPAANWSTFLAQLADTSIKYVRAPEGTFDVGTGIEFYGSVRVIDGRGCILTVASPTIKPFTVTSDSVAANEKQATGTITDSTDRVTVLDGAFLASITVGDNHLIRLGVQEFDPQEPHYSVLRTVVGKSGSVVIYDQPFGHACTVYASEAALEAATNYPDRVGPWGLNQATGWFQRGLGTDHGIKTIGTLAQNVEVNEFSLRYDGNEPMYGAWGFLVGSTRNVRLNQISVHNPHGSAVHLYLATDAQVNGLSITGTGRSDPFNTGAKTTVATAVSSWSSFGCAMRDVHLDCTDVKLMDFESGNREMSFTDCRINASYNTDYDAQPNLGAYGPGDLLLERLRVNITPARSSQMFVAYYNETEISNLTIETAATPDAFLWQGKGDFTGGLTWASDQFSAPETVITQFSCSPPHTSIPYPDGIIMECTFSIVSRTGFSSFNIGGDPFVDNPGATTFAKTDTQNQIAANKTYAEYRATLASHLIYREMGSGSATVTMTTKVMRLIA